MNVLDKVRLEADAFNKQKALNEKRKSIVDNCIPDILKQLSSYGDISKLKFDYGKLQATFMINASGVYTVLLPQAGMRSETRVSLRVKSELGDKVDEFLVGTEAYRDSRFTNLVDACECFMGYLLNSHYPTKESLAEYAKTIPEPWFTKCNNCGNTSKFYATEHTTQRVEVNGNLEAQEGLDCPDYYYDDIVCADCGSIDVTNKGGNVR